MHEFYCAFQQLEEGRKKILIPILLEDLDLDNNNEIDPDKLAVLQQYLRTYTYMDARNYKSNIEKLKKKIIFKLPPTPLSQMLIVTHAEENNDTIDDEQTPLLQLTTTATAESAP